MPDEEKDREVPAEQAKPVVELWEALSDEERFEFRQMAAKLKDELASSSTADEAEHRALVVLEEASPELRHKILEALAWGKKHAWDDRTWAQRLVLVSLIPTLPLAATKAAGIAIGSTAFRVAVPIVLMAGASLVGALADLLVSKKKP